MTPPSSPVPRIRLAQPGERGANLYNGYHLLTQLASVYARMAELDHHAPGRVLLGELADAVLHDLGDVYSAWEHVLQTKAQAPESTLDDPALGAVINRACLRVDAALAASSVWTPMRKWQVLAQLAEKRWQRFATEFSTRENRLEIKMARVLRASQDRCSRLSGLRERYEREAQTMQHAGQVEKALRSEGGRK